MRKAIKVENRDPSIDRQTHRTLARGIDFDTVRENVVPTKQNIQLVAVIKEM